MQAQLLRKRQTLDVVAYAASIADLLVISLLVASQGGFASNVFVFYFPAMLAISVAFPTRQSAVLCGVGVCLALGVSAFGTSDALPLVIRALALAAMAVIGNAYWRLHREHLRHAADKADLFWGQVAAIWARWAIVVGGAALVLAITNFYLHGRYLIEKPANASLTLLASGLDLAMLSVLFFSWTGKAGLGNPCYVLLYPLVFSVGLVFPPRTSWPFTAATLALYVGLAQPVTDLKMLVVRLIALVAVSGLASLYWRSIRQRGAEDETRGAEKVAWKSALAS